MKDSAYLFIKKIFCKTNRFFSLIILWFISFTLLSCAKKSVPVLRISESSQTQVVKAGGNSFSSDRYFSFSNSQREGIRKYRSDNGPAALEVELFIKKVSNKEIEEAKNNQKKDSIGFLTDSDFEKNGKTKKDLETRPVVSSNFAEFSNSRVSVVFCMNKDVDVPSGFFVSCSVPYKISVVKIVPAQIGFDKSRGFPCFAFAPNGGIIDLSSYSADLTGAPLVFNSLITKNSQLPEVVVSLLKNTSGSRVVLDAGGEKITLYQTNKSQVIIPCQSLSNPFSKISVSEHPENVESLLVQCADEKYFDPNVPIKIDPGLIASWKSSAWRRHDFELFEWDRFSHVLFFDTADYSVQDDLFRRLAFFVEKTGYRGQLVSDSELKDKHGYNAHDYSAASLANFFAQAESEHFQLNKMELLLKEILIDNGLIIRSSDGVISEGVGALVSISQESPLYLRKVFIAHEGLHTLYFTDAEFRNTVASVYYTIDPKTLSFLINYFRITPTLDYDVNDDYLIKNEFMAYMLQRPLSQTASYFINMASREHAQWGEKDDADYIIKTGAAGFVSAATMLDEYISTRWLLSAGRIWILDR